MAVKIEPYQQRVMGGSVPGTPKMHVPPMENTATPVREFMDAATSASQAYQHSEQQSGETAALEAATRTRMEFDRQLQAKKEGARPGADGFTPDAMATYDKLVQAEADKLPSEYAKKQFKTRMETHAAAVQEHVLSWESAQRQAKRVDDVKASVDNNASAVFTSAPTQRAATHAQLEAEIDSTLANLALPPNVRDDLREYKKRTLATAAYQADARDRPEQVHSWALKGTTVRNGKTLTQEDVAANPDTPASVKTFKVNPATGDIEGQKPVAESKPKGPVIEGKGVDYYARLRQTESGGNDYDKASTSSAYGRYQFTKGAWEDTLKQHPELGLTTADRVSPAAQELAIRARTEDNARLLAKAGFASTNVNLYMQHFLGPTGGVQFLQGLKADPNGDPRKYVNAESIAANPGVSRPGRTMADVYLRFGHKMGGAHEGGTGAAVTYDKASSVPDYYRNLTVEQREDALNRSRAELSRRQSTNSAAFKQTTDNIVTELSTRGVSTQPYPSENQFIDTYGVNTGGLHYAEFKARSAEAKATYDIQRLPLPQISSYVEALKPEAGDPVYADKMEAYTRVSAAATRVKAAIAADSAGYIQSVHPDVKDALDAVTAAQDADSARAASAKYAGLITAKYDALSVPLGSRRFLPETHAHALAATLSQRVTADTPATAILRSVNAQKERWGDLWPQVLGEVKGNISAPLQVITSGINPRAAAILLEVHDKGFDQLSEVVQTERKPIDKRLNELFVDYKSTTAFTPSGLRDVTTFYEQAKKLSAVYTAQGLTGDEAAKQAYADTVGTKYQFVRDGRWFGNTHWDVRAPKGVDVSRIEKGLQHEGPRIIAGDVWLPPAPEGTTSATVDEVRATMLRDAKWVTLPDDKGVVLTFRNTLVTTKAGKPFVRTWGQLSDTATQVELDEEFASMSDE